MQRVLLILFGAAFATASCWASGFLLLSRLQLAFDPLERVLFSFLCGSALVSTFLCLLSVAHAVYTVVLLALGGGVIAWAAMSRAQPPAGKPLPRLSKSLKYVLAVVFTCYFVVYFLNAIAPEVSPDGAGYHLGNVARILRHHGFFWQYRSMYSAFPQGMEMLFVPAFAFGAHSAAALVHFAFLGVLPLLIVSYGRRFGMPRAAAFAAGTVFASPLFGVVGTSAYNDVALVTCSFAVFYLLEAIDETNTRKYLILIGVLTGFCFALKYTGGLAAVFVMVAFVRLCLVRQPPESASTIARKQRIEGALAWARSHHRDVIACAAAALGVCLPWLIRNWIWLGNPLAPFFNRWFPNQYFSYSAERDYLSGIALFPAFPHWWEFPLDVTVYGARIPGFLGPVLLMAPFALLALRWPMGRRLLVAAVLFSFPMLANADSRFLMPGIPFLALALGMALENSPGVIPVLALFEALVCWPAVMPLYSAPWAWRIRETSVRAALRIEPEAVFLARHFSDYRLKAAVEAIVPKSQKIFSFRTRPEAYFEPTIVVGYESAEGLEVQQILLDAAPHPERRRAAMAALKRLNVGFLLVNRDDPAADGFKNNLNSWGITLIKETDETSFYRID